MRIGLSHQRRFNEAKVEMDNKDKEIRELTAKIQAVDKEISDAKTKIGELEKKLADVEAGSVRKDATVSRLQADLLAANAKTAGSSGASAKVDESALVCFAVEDVGIAR